MHPRSQSPDHSSSCQIRRNALSAFSGLHSVGQLLAVAVESSDSDAEATDVVDGFNENSNARSIGTSPVRWCAARPRLGRSANSSATHRHGLTVLALRAGRAQPHLAELLAMHLLREQEPKPTSK